MFTPQVDPATSIMNVLNIIKDITLLHAPLRKLSRKEMKVKSKPWLTKGLIKSMPTKNKMFHNCFYKKNLHWVAEYNTYLNKLSKIKEIANRKYY